MEAGVYFFVITNPHSPVTCVDPSPSWLALSSHPSDMDDTGVGMEVSPPWSSSSGLEAEVPHWVNGLDLHLSLPSFTYWNSSQSVYLELLSLSTSSVL